MLDAYDRETHREIAQRSVELSISSLDQILKDELGLRRGITENFTGRSDPRPRTIQELIGDGAIAEDTPITRQLNHFHNPLVEPWQDASLRVFFGAVRGQSSVLWQQNTTQNSTFVFTPIPLPSGGDNWSWQDARQRYLRALTGMTRAEREGAFAETFETLGHLTHLIQDASVPAHVRNDPHPPFLFRRDWYEDWATRNSAKVLALLNNLPKGPTTSIFTSTGNSQAPIPIARLIDTDSFLGLNSQALSVQNIGIAEYTNGNFLSRGTLFKTFDLPQPSSLVAGDVLQVKPQKFRRYFQRTLPDATVINHFVTEGMLFDSLVAAQSALPGVGGWYLDDLVHEGYAKELLPRAVGYSAALLDYFFRGRLDVDLQEDPNDSTRIQLVGTNGSADTLVDGTLTLYSDDPAGTRSQMPGFTPMVLAGVKLGDPLTSSPPSFQPPENAERFVAVYQGTLGLEKKDGTFPGGVIGKVLGGVRVEEIFSDGVRWKLRTPQGVFLLPLMVAEFEEVRWGDGDNILVARTPLGPGRPNRVAAYEVQRQPGSVDLVTVDPPDGPEAQVTKKTEALFPFGMSLGTTVQFSQTIQYRQQLAKFEPRKTVFRFEEHPEACPNCGFYVLDHFEFGPLQIETVVNQAVPFSETFPITLELERSLDFVTGAGAPQYGWSLQEVTADRSGRLLAVVAVFLTSPASPPVALPFFGLNQQGGLEVIGHVLIVADFQVLNPLLWAVVDLKEQLVVASTADPSIAISSQTAAAEPIWAPRPNPGRPAAFVYAHFLEERLGGPQAGIVDNGWLGLSVQLVSPLPALSVTELQTQKGVRALSADGWLRKELKGELTQRGLFSPQAVVRTSSEFDLLYDCTDIVCFGLHVTNFLGVVQGAVFLNDARRARPAPGGERLAFQAEGLVGTGGQYRRGVGPRDAERTGRVPDPSPC